LVTPLDVVKTRLQAQVQIADCDVSRTPTQCPKCTHYALHNGLMDVMVPRSKFPHAFLEDCPHHFTGTFNALYKIRKFEGFSSLYNGLRPGLIMAIPSTVLYFASYDKFRLFLQTDPRVTALSGDVVSPLVAGSSARTLATTMISPLELLRTKIQAMENPPSMYKLGRQLVKSNGMLSLWQGLSPTLLRDVPFSAVYWVSVERSKVMLRPYSREQGSFGEFMLSFAAGSVGGFVAATLTNPFDVLKTRRQVFEYSVDTALPNGSSMERSSVTIMSRILREEGVGGFFTGLAPRLGKIVPACAIMLSSYEYGKAFFLDS